MTFIDRFLQSWRIRVAAKRIPVNSDLLDVGCADAALFRSSAKIKSYVGVEPHLQIVATDPRMKLLNGIFPDVPQEDLNFDCITMLACLEHVPETTQPRLAQRCYELLRPQGRVIISVPNPFVDEILKVLVFLRLIDGMEVGEHYHYDVSLTEGTFTRAGLKLVEHKRFQLGLNNLFVFEKP